MGLIIVVIIHVVNDKELFVKAISGWQQYKRLIISLTITTLYPDFIAVDYFFTNVLLKRYKSEGYRQKQSAWKEFPPILQCYCYYQCGKVFFLVFIVSFPIMFVGFWSLFILAFLFLLGGVTTLIVGIKKEQRNKKRSNRNKRTPARRNMYIQSRRNNNNNNSNSNGAGKTEQIATVDGNLNKNRGNCDCDNNCFAKCACQRSSSGDVIHSKMTRIIFYFCVVLFVQNIIFAGINMTNGHMWIVASVRAFLGTDGCFDNGLFWSNFSGNNEYDFTQIIVYLSYWIV